ncbi:E3 ubiquitin-protein ligase [Pelomyxa schiedti]|nr:E3 ubiquitin-protein ligase [Pelomyxa schiedti]
MDSPPVAPDRALPPPPASRTSSTSGGGTPTVPPLADQQAQQQQQQTQSLPHTPPPPRAVCVQFREGHPEYQLLVLVTGPVGLPPCCDISSPLGGAAAAAPPPPQPPPPPPPPPSSPSPSPSTSTSSSPTTTSTPLLPTVSPTPSTATTTQSTPTPTTSSTPSPKPPASPPDSHKCVPDNAAGSPCPQQQPLSQIQIQIQTQTQKQDHNSGGDGGNGGGCCCDRDGEVDSDSDCDCGCGCSCNADGMSDGSRVLPADSTCDLKGDGGCATVGGNVMVTDVTKVGQLKDIFSDKYNKWLGQPILRSKDIALLNERCDKLDDATVIATVLATTQIQPTFLFVVWDIVKPTLQSALTEKRAAVNHLSTYNFVSAVGCFSRAISIAAHFSPPPLKLLSVCYTGRAEAMLKLNLDIEAADDALQALYYHPQNAWAFFHLGMCHFRAQSFTNAVSIWTKGFPYAERRARKDFKKWIGRCSSSEIKKNGILGLPMENDPLVITVLLKKAMEANESRDYKGTIFLLSKVLELSPTEPEALYQLGMLLQNQSRKPEQATALFSRGAEAYPQKPEFHIALGDAYSILGKPHEALASYKKARECVTNSSNPQQSTVDSITVKIGDAFLSLNDVDNAMRFYSSILARDQTHIGALMGYSNVLFSRARSLSQKDQKKSNELHEEALQVRLHVLVANSKDELAREAVTESVSTPGGMDRLFKQLTVIGSESAAAFAFIASLIKDFGRLSEACLLYEQAVSLQPQNFSYVLNLVHAFECRGWYKSAILTIQNFLMGNGDLSVSGVSASHILAVIQPLNVGKWTSERPDPNPLLIPGPLPIHLASPSVASSIVPTASTSNSQSAVTPATPERPTVASYTHDELNLLALFFTIPKILFILGHVSFVPPLVALLECCRNGHDLHLTMIRNEQAFFQVVTSLSSLTTIQPSDLATPPIYLLGDSNCLSAAWQKLTIEGETRLLHPYLVTGLKIWHLRKESRFYPKHNFYSLADLIPNKAWVIAILGEIDCREGLLISVEKGRYKDMEEAAATTIQIYLNVLLRLISKKNWTVFVHPVSPVLPETRQIVHEFNQILCKVISYAGEKRLRWLDFGTELLAPSSEIVIPIPVPTIPPPQLATQIQSLSSQMQGQTHEQQQQFLRNQLQQYLQQQLLFQLQQQQQQPPPCPPPQDGPTQKKPGDIPVLKSAAAALPVTPNTASVVAAKPPTTRNTQSKMEIKPHFLLDGTHLHPSYVQAVLQPALVKALSRQ